MGKRDKIGERIKRAYNQYDEKIKQEVVDAYVYGKEGIYKLSNRYGIKPQTIYLWLTQAMKRKNFAPSEIIRLRQLLANKRKCFTPTEKEQLKTNLAFTQKKHSPKPFNILVSVSDGRKVVKLEECDDMATANAVSSEWKRKGYEVDITELK